MVVPPNGSMLPAIIGRTRHGHYPLPHFGTKKTSAAKEIFGDTRE
jgi:hypothetical protein